MKFTKELKSFWNSTNGVTVCTKRELLLGGIALTVTGMVLGMLLSPRKDKTIHFGSEVYGADPEETEDEE